MKRLLLAVPLCAAALGLSTTSFAATSCNVPTYQHHATYVHPYVHHAAYHYVHRPVYHTVYRTVYRPVYQPAYYQPAYYRPGYYGAYWHHGDWDRPNQPAIVVRHW